MPRSHTRFRLSRSGEDHRSQDIQSEARLQHQLADQLALHHLAVIHPYIMASGFAFIRL